MAITWSKGYAGQVTDVDLVTWARALGGLDYAVSTAASWQVTAVSAAARTVQIAAGGGSGRSIADASNGGDQVVLPNPASGQLWHLIVTRRTKGATKATTFTYTPGASDPWVAMSLRATFESTSGAYDDQPLALVRVAKDVPAVQQIIDVRCWQANGGTYGASDYVRGYLDRPGTQVMIGTDLLSLGVTSGGNLKWSRIPLMRPVNLLAADTALSGGTPPADAATYEQAGTRVLTTDANAAAQLVFPVPFPNGLLHVSLENGDELSTNDADLRLLPEGNVIGTRSHVWYRLYGPLGTVPYSRGMLANRAHRVVWTAKGW